MIQKITSLCVLILISVTTVNAQKCASTEATNALFKKHPELKTKFEAYQATFNANYNALRIANTSATPNYTIPMVFHILHLNGTENISDAQVLDAVKILNIDYAKKNADTANTLPVFRPIADSTSIRFALAKKDPNGNCTSGIVRYLNSDANWDDNSSTLYAQAWDPTKYLNIFVVKTITMSSGFSAAGYTYLPGTWASGDPSDAIVLLHDYTGSIGTSSVFHSHVLTHEVGHWFNLNHVFGWNSCGVDCNNDDYVYDTPQTPGYLSCPSHYDICTAGVPENYQNFMDYSYCETMFTHGQALRMDASAHDPMVGRNNLWSSSNLLATGISPAAPCAPVANFKSNKQVACVGDAVNFTDLSNVGTPTNWSWVLAGATPSVSSVQNPTVTYNSPGIHQVQLIASNSVGNSVPEIKTGYITVLPTGISTPISEGFESATIPNNQWFTRNTATNNINWVQTSNAAATGVKSAFVNENVSPVSVVELISPSYNFSIMQNVALTLKWAGAEYNYTTTDCDNFSVMFSSNCGVTWTPHFVRNIRASTAGVSGVVSGNFYPSAAQFKQETIPFFGDNTLTNVIFKLKFTSESGGSNNFYVDDINLTDITGIKETQQAVMNVAAFPNPTMENTTLQFDLLATKNIEISLHDVLGRFVKNIDKKQFTAGHYEFPVKLDDLSKGLYFIQLNIEGVMSSQKIMVN